MADCRLSGNGYALSVAKSAKNMFSLYLCRGEKMPRRNYGASKIK